MKLQNHIDYEGLGMIEAIEDTRCLDYLFAEKSVPAWIDYWGHDVNHDWPWWYRQMNYFLEHLFF